MAEAWLVLATDDAQQRSLCEVRLRDGEVWVREDASRDELLAAVRQLAAKAWLDREVANARNLR